MPEVRRRVRESARKVVVLDDDPTGGQTVHGLPVLTRWSADVLEPALAEESPAVFVLTNSRSLTGEQAAARCREIAEALADVSQRTDRDFDVLVRGDSTLRGHFPLELDAVRAVIETLPNRRIDGVVVCPFFLEGGRLTAGDTHWVTEGDILTPAAQTEFARDPTFGYASSSLPAWVEEKTGGSVSAGDVVSISLKTIRRAGPQGVCEALARVEDAVIAVNAVSYRDMAVFVAGLLAAQDAGKRFLFRTGASYVKVRAGVSDRGLLTPHELATSGGAGGLVVVGSFVQKSSRQLSRALAEPGVVGVELRVPKILDGASRSAEIARVSGLVDGAITRGSDAIVYTSRELVSQHGVDSALDIGGAVSAALVEVVRGITTLPRFLITKGGNTSSEIATQGLGVVRAWILGQILPGVPVWRLEAESRYPGMSLVVFPGNVGTDDSLVEAMGKLRRR